MKRNFDDLMLGSIELFCVAAETQNFSAAAALAGVTPAAVSRSVSRLEERLGVRLFVRTTRHIGLTEIGKMYFEQSRQALSQLIEAERMVTGDQAAPQGKLRISMATPYGHHRVLPLLPIFRQQYPLIDIEVHLDNRNIDFAEEGFDLAIRGRAPVDSTLTARKLEDAELVVVATPAYLQRHGIPQALADLEQHDCIQFELPSSGRNIPWLFQNKQAQIELPTTGGYTCAGDILAGATLVANGAGLFQTYRFVVDKQIKDGTLQEVLTDFGGRSRPFTLLYPHRRHLSQRVRTFVNFIVSSLGA